MRTLASTFCWIIAVVAGILAVPVTWIADHLADESGYVSLMHDLREDQELLAAVSDIVAADLVDSLGLPDGLREQVAQRLRDSLDRIEQIEGFPEAWDEMQRRSHALWFDARRVPDELQLDIAPLAALAVEPIRQGVSVEIQVPGQMLVTVANAPPGLRFVETTPTWKTIVLIAVVAATFLCFVFANRRSLALAWIGVGALLVAGASYVGARLVVPLVLERTERGASTFGQVLSDAVSERFLASLDSWVQTLAIAGAAALAIGVLARLLSARRS